MADRDQLHDPDQAVWRACAQVGLRVAGARLLHHYSNAIFHLPAENAVARVTTGTGAPSRVRLTHALAIWLADEQGFPATRPLPGTEPIVLANDTVVSFWTYHHQPVNAAPLTSADLALLLRRLHRLDAPHLALPPWVPLVSLADTIHDERLSAALDPGERSWVAARIQQSREMLANLELPLGIGLIHGDAWAGNLLHAGAGTAPVVLGDWDWASIGPREVDLVPTWHAASRYGKGKGWTCKFVEAYGYDLANWDGFPVLMAMRDLVQLTGPIRRAGESGKHAAVLRQRLDALRSGDTTSQWVAL